MGQVASDVSFQQPVAMARRLHDSPSTSGSKGKEAQGHRDMWLHLIMSCSESAKCRCTMGMHPLRSERPNHSPHLPCQIPPCLLCLLRLSQSTLHVRPRVFRHEASEFRHIPQRGFRQERDTTWWVVAPVSQHRSGGSHLLSWADGDWRPVTRRQWIGASQPNSTRAHAVLVIGCGKQQSPRLVA